ncbi:MAG TPA: cyclic peptide export ABC transporter [Pyrinomonadaceae bacterium]|jgi:putative ATP-binding cassette transporter|nr:cyclic peptide export ABC transporter [Pyrinomonadaceae bacterium]
MKLIKFLLRSSPRVVIIAIIAGLVAGISNTGLLALINATLNQTGTPSRRSLWFFIALGAVMLISRCASSISLAWLARGAIVDLRMQLCRRIIAAPLRQLEELGASRLMATLTDDVPTLSFALTTIPVLCMHFAVIVTCLIYMAWLSWAVFLGVIGFMVVGVLSYYIPSMRAFRYMNATRKGWDLLSKHLQALTQGTKELKLHHQRREAFFTESLEATSESIRLNGLKGDKIYAIISAWGQLLVFVLIGVLLFVVPAFGEINRQTLIGYILVVLYMMTPLEVLLNLVPGFGRANVAIRTVEELGLSLEARVNDSLDTPIAPLAKYQSLNLRNVTHAYRREGAEETFIFGPIDLSFHPAELVFLVGGNGSGKTTLAKLLTGLYIPESGEVRLDGELITDETRENYRQLFATVFSDFYLFDTLLGLDKPDLDAQSHYYLSTLQLAHKVQVIDRKLSTIELSQGQRKRLALMTAYLEDRPFYVFDEWAADQDPYFKEFFYLQLLPELKAKGKTVVVISHDDRYYYMADRIIKLDYGKVVSENNDVYSEAAITSTVA